MTNYTLSPNPVTGKNYIIFNDSPFKLSTLEVSIVATDKSFSHLLLGVSTVLTPGRDYFPVFLFNQATAELGVSVYGGIQFTDPALQGIISVTLTGLGPLFAASPSVINGIYNNDEIEPSVDYWEKVVSGLPPYPHSPLIYNAESPVKVADLSGVLLDLEYEQDESYFKETILRFGLHVNSTENPHAITAHQIGLGKVPNWTTGDAASIIAGGSPTEFVTPLAIKDSVGTVMPAATQDIAGLIELNQGSSPDDSINSTDGLTSAGLIYLLENELIASGASLVNNQRQEVAFTPFPIIYPATWNGIECNNFEALVNAVQENTGISKLTAYAQEGIVYFPHSATAPDLTLS